MGRFTYFLRKAMKNASVFGAELTEELTDEEEEDEVTTE
jgi:hypothetical protein